MMIHNKAYTKEAEQEILDLDILMNTVVKKALNIPENVTWSSTNVFDTLRTDFMKPVTEGSKYFFIHIFLDHTR